MSDDLCVAHSTVSLVGVVYPFLGKLVVVKKQRDNRHLLAHKVFRHQKNGSLINFLDRDIYFSSFFIKFTPFPTGLGSRGVLLVHFVGLKITKDQSFNNFSLKDLLSKDLVQEPILERLLIH